MTLFSGMKEKAWQIGVIPVNWDTWQLRLYTPYAPSYVLQPMYMNVKNKLLETAVAPPSEWQEVGMIQKWVRFNSRIGTNKQISYKMSTMVYQGYYNLKKCLLWMFGTKYKTM